LSKDTTVTTKPHTPTPKTMATFPPRGYVRPHKVQTGENWWTLAEKYRRKDPWDLIRFNFGTSNPDEVNWYLANKVGCTLTTDDRKNFRFSSNASPGLIYIPRKRWKGGGSGTSGDPTAAVDHAAAKDCVYKSLTWYDNKHIDFELGGYKVTPAKLTRVANAVQSGKINVLHNPDLGGACKYFHRNDDENEAMRNTIEIGFTYPREYEQQAVVIHEAIHASMDLESHTISDDWSEAIAYVTQFLFLLYYDKTTGKLYDLKGFRRPDGMSKGEWKETMNVFTMAYLVAKKIWKGEDVDAFAEFFLLAAIRTHRRYADNEADAGYDGVLDA
jgi:hypothetical protein